VKVWALNQMLGAIGRSRRIAGFMSSHPDRSTRIIRGDALRRLILRTDIRWEHSMRMVSTLKTSRRPGSTGFAASVPIWTCYAWLPAS
jgi:hypothetical protein